MDDVFNKQIMTRAVTKKYIFESLATMSNTAEITTSQMYFPTNLKTRNSKKAYSGIQINFPLAAAITVSKK